ncbi:DUF3304 domain-containing protein [Herbaspirillum rubrisubalbicans]|uniref:DUF3304 domain-containing protein n=1 Tax=Herbaspirillum rubrisubalbicans TaxID=80842 RepID=UPI001ED99E07|nr:DUF3304 domain-containing protein [Herbaspirillum rubrisubalbicans]
MSERLSPSRSLRQVMLNALLLMLILLWLVACDNGQPAAAFQDSDSVTVSTDAVNYMHDWGLGYTLFNQADNQPIGSGILGFLEGPGGKGCCLKLPKKWKPGMQVRVEWQKSNKKMTEETMRIKVMEIPEYDEAGDLYVAFYPGDEVEVVVSWAEPGHPEWRGREAATPYEACLSKMSKKVCEKELPKYPPGSAEQAALRMRRACKPERLETELDPVGAEAICQLWVVECKRRKFVEEKMCELDFEEE